MKIKALVSLSLVLGILLLFTTSALAQLIELDTKQDLTISNSGFFPFSQAANDQFKQLIKQNPLVSVVISNFNGTKLKIAPAKDFREIGHKQQIKENGVVVLDFRKAKSGKTIGLSFVPAKKPTSLTVQVQPFAGRPCPNPITNCADACGENLGLCCEKDGSGNQTKICVRGLGSSCGCGTMSN